MKTLSLGRNTQKSAGRKGVSGRRSEDFITGREHKKKKNKCRWEGEGGLVEEGVKTLLLRGSTQK